MAEKRKPWRVLELPDGRRFRIVPLAEWHTLGPNRPVTRTEALELLALERWNRRMRRPWWRLWRGACALLRIQTRFVYKGSMRIPIGEP